MDIAPYSLIIAGDLVVEKSYNILDISEEIVDLFLQSNLNILNLESPITDSVFKHLKTGPHIKGDKESTLQILEKLKINIVTLANNHILDYGSKGLNDTIDFCSDNKIQYVGAGLNISEAGKTLYIDTDVGRIAIVNFCENEWCIATEDSPGANPMDVISNVNQIIEAKVNSDIVIVIVHGGNEYFSYPSPRMQKQYRYYVDQGASLVVGHHTHCVSGSEIYKGVPIYYSLGNFLFTRKSEFTEWYIGGCLKVNIKNGLIATEIIPVKQSKETYQLDLLNNSELEKFKEKIDYINSIIYDKVKLQKMWDDFILKVENSYLNYLSPLSFIGNRYIRAIIQKMNIKLFNKKGTAILLNMMRCEAHRDISKEVIKKYLLK